MDQCVHEIRDQNWLDIVNSANASGQRITDFCNEHGINRRSFYYHQSKIRKQAYNELVASGTVSAQCNTMLTERQSMVQVPVVSAQQPANHFLPAAVISIGSVTIGIAEGTSEDLLMKIGKMIHNAL